MPHALEQYWNLLANYLSPQKRRVVYLAIALFGGIALQLVSPQILRYFIDTAIADAPEQDLYAVAFLFISVAFTKQILSVGATYFSENIAWTATNALRADLAQHCLNLDLSFHKERTSGELIERVDGDVSTLSRFFSEFTLAVLGNVVLLVGILVVLFREDWRAGLCLGLFAFTALASLVRLRSFAIPFWKTYRQVSAEFFGFLSEKLAAREDLRANGAVSYTMRRLYQIGQRWLPAFHQARLAGTILWGTTVGLFALGNAIALAVGAYLWNAGAVTIGTVYLIFHYSHLLRQPIEQIRTHLEDLQQAEASIYRIQELFQMRSLLKDIGEQPLPTGALSIAFQGVYFRYQPTEDQEWTLENLSFYLPPGQVLGLLGRTGSGKTTIARLLLRLYDRQAGSIHLGNVATDATPLKDLRQRVGLVTQNVQLFQTTVRNNLTFFDSDIDDEQIHQALSQLGLSPWLHLLPNGLDTHLGADSGGLSAGEAQLLAFARIFLKNPGLVILDEASSRLDPATEALIESAIKGLLQARTGIIIAHRLSTVQRADQILILEKGRAIEYGRREDLVSNPKSRFSQLLNMGSMEVLA